MEIISILHGADYHTKNKEKNLFSSQNQSLSNITYILINEKIDIYVMAGDLFDNANPNDSERKIINKHIGDVLNIPTLKELVVMLGNHDILSDKKQISINKENNAFDSLHKFIEALSPELSEKVTYLKLQKQYVSKANSNLAWIPYSLEDGMSNGNNINWDLIDNSKYNVSIYHDILVDFVEDTKLPVRKDKLDKLCKLSDFKTNLVLAGDIHKNYEKSYFNRETEINTEFIYPGSTNQVNFAEGAYIKIRKNPILTKADVKVVKKYDIEFSGNTCVGYTKEDIVLDSFVNYITIDLNTNQTFPNFVDQITDTLSQCTYGLNQTFIKLKMSNSYLKYEMDIIKLVEKISATKSSVTEIHTVYDKFVLASDGANVGDIEVGDFEVEDGSDDLKIDDLKLDTKRLEDLFDKVLTKHVTDLTKEIGDNELVKDIVENIKTLFAEQIELSLSSVPNYTTILNWVDTNNFMNLGPNKIILNIPGLTQIKGTNGIGKTTLYNMVRWIIDGVVFEGLKANQKVKNTLLVFNDKQFNLDTVISRLNAHINGTNVLITRSAFRKWKTNATDDIKKSINWKDYIAEVNTSIKVTVAKADGEPKDFTGEEAETLIKRWFGNVTNTIMILNQQKILTMLNLPADKLQELVLDYIGVDYLKVMKENLPLIKSQYNLQRPKTKIEDLRIELSNATKTKNEGNVAVEKMTDTITQLNKDIKLTEEKIELIQKEQIDLGNIPDLIESIQNNIVLANDNIENFVSKELKIIEEFNGLNPIEPVISNENSILLSNYTTEINETKLLIDTLEDDFLHLSENIKRECNVNIDANQEFIDKTWFDANVIYQTELNTNQTEFDFSFNQMSEQYKSLLEQLKIKQTSKVKEISELNSATNTLKVRIISIDNELKSGVCVTCSRAFNDDFEQHKTKLLAEKSEKEDLILLNDKSLIELNTEKTNIDSFVNSYQNYYEKSLTKNINWFETCEPNKAINVSQISELVLIKKKIVQFTQLIEKTNSKDLQYFEKLQELSVGEKDSWKFSDDIKNWNKNTESIKELKELIFNKSWEKLVIYNIEAKSSDIDKLIHIVNDITICYEKIDIAEKKIKFIKDEFTLLRDNYVKELQSYNDALQQYQTNVNNIQSENLLINKHNDKLNEYIIQLNQYLVEKEKHEKNLDKYNQLIKDYDFLVFDKESLNQERNTINNNKIVIEKELIGIDNTINNLNIEYENYIEYKKHSNIYGLYDKLINKDFPQIVFEYYRKFLNNTLNVLLSDMNFKLYWHQSLDLYMIQMKNGVETYRPVQLVSGMETSFLGLSLIYAIHTLNIKNSISNLFIDEISGQLNSGKELSEMNVINYQEQLVLLLSKFGNKNIFIIDHVIENLFQTHTYEVVLNENNTAIYKSIE